jgi:hypothetical protein
MRTELCGKHLERDKKEGQEISEKREESEREREREKGE